MHSNYLLRGLLAHFFSLKLFIFFQDTEDMSHKTTSYVRVYPKSTTSDKTSSLNSLAPETKDVIIPHFIKSEPNYTVRTKKIPFFSECQSYIPQMKWIILICARYIGMNSFFTGKHIQFKRQDLLSLLITQNWIPPFMTYSYKQIFKWH